MTELAVIVGARPNLVKAAPLLEAFSRRRGLSARLIHTGQHYDHAMNGALIRDLGLPRAAVELGVGSGSQAVQTARVMVRLEAHLRERPVDRIVVVVQVGARAGALGRPRRGEDHGRP